MHISNIVFETHFSSERLTNNRILDKRELNSKCFKICVRLHCYDYKDYYLNGNEKKNSLPQSENNMSDLTIPR